MKKLVAILGLAALVVTYGTAQESPEAAPPAFQAGINLGTDVLPTGPLGENEAWSRLGFQPDIALGKFGIGLDLTLRFKLYPQPDQAIEVYQGDWVPDYQGNGRTILDVYLPKFLYVRYGREGQDPLYAKIGSINDLTLGNGFIMSAYSNMSFLPEQRITGLDVSLDGRLFNFPYLGMELLTGNLARLDVLGGRLFVRPLVGTELPILKNLQIGLTAVMDNDPSLYDPTNSYGATDPVLIYGLDAMLPIFNTPIASLATFVESAIEPNGSMGAMLGAGGKFLGIFYYGAQLRYLGAGFIPSYFDTNYDLYRAAKAAYMKLDPSGDGKIGWFASLGTSLLQEKIVFNAGLDGPFKKTGTSQADYPHLRAIAILGEGLVGGFFANASYEKYMLGAEDSFFADMIDPTDAIVGLGINYKTGASVLTLLYNAKWMDGEWKVSSSLQASMKF